MTLTTQSFIDLFEAPPRIMASTDAKGTVAWKRTGAPTMRACMAIVAAS